MVNLILLSAYVLTSTYGLMKIKSAGISASPEFAIGFVSYAVGFIIWLYILARMPLSVAFPIAAGSLVIATQLTGHFFLSEVITHTQLIGVLLVVAGISLIYVRVH